jgi:GntR family transcriptional repressor for pyruvate dehydrogenase complex
MIPNLEPLRVDSLKQACVARLEELILSGDLKPGERLPAERDFATALGVSRPVLHEALVDLSAKGLITILPRRGVEVNDFRKSGSAALISSLLAYKNGQLDPHFTDSLLAMRILVETETARLAAQHASAAQLAELKEILVQEESANPKETDKLTALDFEFHLALAIASDNLAYPLILNSFKNVYTHFTGAFFSLVQDLDVRSEVLSFHSKLITALNAHDPSAAAKVMRDLLLHGERHLRASLKEDSK